MFFSASKHFLISIGDRTVGGLSRRDPMVGPWQVPVADCAVTLADYAGFRGEVTLGKPHQGTGGSTLRWFHRNRWYRR